jgi:hypothetical protein
MIPVQIPVVKPLEQSWDAEEITGDVNFTPEEMDKIDVEIRRPEEFVTVWQVGGPFSKKGVEGFDLFDVKFGPENNNNYADWKVMPVGKEGYEADIINLAKFFGNNHSIAYLKTTVWSEKSQKVLFELGSDDGIKVWLNSTLVHQNNTIRGHNQAEDIVEVNLNEGWNTVLLKITQGAGGWGASLVITDLDHKPIDSLKYR